MTYEQAVEFMQKTEHLGSVPGLDRIRELLSRMGNPQDKLKFVHIAGTNGKGSTGTMLANVLREAGYRIGWFTSPVVIHQREAIQIDGDMIDEDAFAQAVERVQPHWELMCAEGTPATEFETLTAVAIAAFCQAQCDIVVLEAGLGGAKDATNVVETTLVSVLTPISLDHTQYLGDTVEEIAREKCGIIRQGKITVSAYGQSPDALAVIMEACAESENVLLIGSFPQVVEELLKGSRIKVGEIELFVPLAGAHQIQNAVTVVETCRALESLGFCILPEHLERGIAQTSMPARFEVLQENPLVILDGAHNPAGAAVLEQALELIGMRNLYGVCAMSADKDIDRCLEMILPHCKSVIVTAAAKAGRAMPAQELERLAKKYHPDVICEENPILAWEQGLSRCKADDALLIFGSLYLAADIRRVILGLDK